MNETNKVGLSDVLSQQLCKVEEETKPKRRKLIDQLVEIRDTEPKLIFYWLLETENNNLIKKFITLLYNKYNNFLSKVVRTEDLKSLLKEISNNKFAIQQIFISLEKLVEKDSINVNLKDIIDDYIKKYKKQLNRF